MSSKTAQFFDLVAQRRSNYALTRESDLSQAEIQSIVERAVKHCPTSFNLQSVGAVVCFGDAYAKTMDAVKAVLLEKVLKDNDAMAAKTKGQFDAVFSAGHGVVLFFNDTAITEQAAKNMPAYSWGFPIWAEDSSGMLQYIVWTALSAEGMACNLQHHASFDPAVNEAILKSHDLPSTWQCTGFMPFGKAAAPPSEKSFNSLGERVRVFN